MISVRSNNLSLKYLIFTPLSYKDIGIRKFEITTTQKVYYAHFNFYITKTIMLCELGVVQIDLYGWWNLFFHCNKNFLIHWSLGGVAQWSRDEQNPLFETSEFKFFYVFFWKFIYIWEQGGWKFEFFFPFSFLRSCLKKKL